MLDKWRWTPEIDWGQLGKVDPGWITVGIALVVGVFTIKGVRTAVKAYKDGVKNHQIATARLVWSVVTESGYIEKGDPIPEVALAVDSHFWWDSEVTTKTEWPEGAAKMRRVSRVNQRSVFAVIEVTNRSAEPIGDITTRIYDASGRAVVGNMMSFEKVLRPNDTRTWLYVTPAPEEADVFTETTSSEQHSSILFHDSAGLVWRRTDTDPPERDEGRAATKAYEKAQAELWQRTKERRAESRARDAARRRDERAAAKKAAAESSDAAEQGDSDV